MLVPYPLHKELPYLQCTPVCTRSSLAQGLPMTHLHTYFASGVALHKDDSLHKGFSQPICTPVLHKEHLWQEGSPLYRCFHKPFAHPFCTKSTPCMRASCTRGSHIGTPILHHDHPMHKRCPQPILLNEYPLHKDCPLHSWIPQHICTLISHEARPLHERFPLPMCTLILHDEHPRTRAAPCTRASQNPFAHLFLHDEHPLHEDFSHEGFPQPICTLILHDEHPCTRAAPCTRGSHNTLAHPFYTRTASCTRVSSTSAPPSRTKDPTAHTHRANPPSPPFSGPRSCSPSP